MNQSKGGLRRGVDHIGQETDRWAVSRWEITRENPSIPIVIQSTFRHPDAGVIPIGEICRRPAFIAEVIGPVAGAVPTLLPEIARVNRGAIIVDPVITGHGEMIGKG